MLNGHEHPFIGPSPEELGQAQKRLAEAAGKQPMTPGGAAISAYINGVVNAATLSALVEYCTTRVEADAAMDFGTILLKHIETKTELLNQTAREATRLQVVGADAIRGHG